MPTEIIVTYTDGTEDKLAILPIHNLYAERAGAPGSDQTRGLSALGISAYTAATGVVVPVFTGRPPKGFDEWFATVDGIAVAGQDDEDGEDEGLDPTQPEAGTG